MTDSETIRVTVNGQVHEVPGPITVEELLQRFDVQSRHTAVERNREIVPRERFAATRVCAGDVLEIVTLVGGG